MARQETDKEDLIRDATALVQRAEFVGAVDHPVITVGFYRDGRMAVYCDQDPFYQFDSDGRLRRAFENGLLYRSQGTTLARLDRKRRGNGGPDGAVILERTDLEADSLAEFQARMKHRLREIRAAIESGNIRILRAVTGDGGLPQGTLEMLNQVLNYGSSFLAAPPGGR